MSIFSNIQSKVINGIGIVKRANDAFPIADALLAPGFMRALSKKIKCESYVGLHKGEVAIFNLQEVATLPEEINAQRSDGTKPSEVITLKNFSDFISRLEKLVGQGEVDDLMERLISALEIEDRKKLGAAFERAK